MPCPLVASLPNLAVTLILFAALAVGIPVANAQETPKPDQLKKMYDDALAQLKDAQNRKNELSSEVEKLKAANAKLAERLAQLEKQLTATDAENAQLKDEQANWAGQTFNLRAHYAAWQAFIRLYPAMGIRWHYYLEHSFPTSTPDAIPLLDGGWPFSIAW